MRESDLLSAIETDFQRILNKRVKANNFQGEGVPSVEDSTLSFEGGDTKTCLRIETAVLFIDIRRSTEINLAHEENKVALLYAGFLRAMMEAASFYGGVVRNIVGDSIMVVFPVKNCCANALRTAIFMNSVAKNIIDKHFAEDDIRAGIGIDHGPMLVSKVGKEIEGKENHAYKNLVWLGRPANIASKLTDFANRRGAAAMVQFQWEKGGLSYLDTQVPLHRFHEEFSITGSGAWVAKLRYKGNAVYKYRVVDSNEYSPPILVTERTMILARKDWQLDETLAEKNWPVIQAISHAWIGDKVLGGRINWSKA